MLQHLPAMETYEACRVLEGSSCWFSLYTVSMKAGFYLLLGIEILHVYGTLEHFFVTLCLPLGTLVSMYMLGQIILLIQRTGALETERNEHALAIQDQYHPIN